MLNFRKISGLFGPRGLDFIENYWDVNGSGAKKGMPTELHPQPAGA